MNAKALVLVAVAVLAMLVAYLALLAVPPAQPPVQPPTQTPAGPPAQQSEAPVQAEKPRNATLTLKVYGPGSLLVNGTGYVNATLPLRVPAVLAINASAPKGWRLKALLVNGSPVLPGVARVVGDTTVEAVFERAGNVVRFVNVRVPVSLNGTVYAGDFEVGFEGVLRLNLSPYGVDDAGCVPFNETVKVCLEGWRRLSTNQTLWVRWLVLNLSDSEVFEQVWGYAPAKLEGAVIELIAGNTTVKTVVQPSKTMLVPFRATYKYLGNGWFWVNGSIWVFYISMPPWKKIKVEFNYTSPSRSAGRLTVVVRNDNLYFDVGIFFGNTAKTCVIDRTIIDLFYPWTFKSRDELDDFWFQTDYSPLFSCATLGSKTSAGPSPRVPPGVKQGDLEFEGSGEAYIRITILEQP